MYKPGHHVYLAAPFFNDAQRDLCSFIEAMGHREKYEGPETNYAPIYSPRKDGGILQPDSPDEMRKQVFESNTEAISQAKWVLAVVDDFDAGVMWEMGYAWAKKIPMLGYSDVEGRGLNVMLAGSCELGFVNGRQPLYSIYHGLTPFPRNTWRGRIQ